MRIAVFVVHTSTFFRYLLNSMFALCNCLIVRLHSDLAVHHTLGTFGSLGLCVYISWQNAVYLAGEFRGKLKTNDELDVCAR